MQPCSREMQAMNSLINQSLQLQHSQIQDTHFDLSSSSSHNDDFLEQILNTIPPSSSWPHDMISHPPAKSPWDDGQQQQLNMQTTDLSDETAPSSSHFNYGDDQSAFLATKLRQHQISSGGGHDGVATAAKLLLQQEMMMARVVGGGGDCRMTQLPLSSMNGETDFVNGSFKSPNQALYNSFAGSLHGAGQAPNQSQPFHPQGGAMQAQSFNSTMTNQSQASGSNGGAPQQPRQRVRARRGQATDPHSIAERLRRERIAERMKALQELVPNANKTDKASMLDEIIDYVKFLQLQVKVLSMSRLGGAAAVAPLVADMSSEGGGDCPANTTTNGNHVTAAASSSTNNDGSNSLTMTEHQVAKLMEQDMGQAMQYLQGKGLCLMPISLATAISTATCRTTPSILHNNIHHPLNIQAGEAPTSPTISALTVQSATLANGGANANGSVKDAASVSKP